MQKAISYGGDGMGVVGWIILGSGVLLFVKENRQNLGHAQVDARSLVLIVNVDDDKLNLEPAKSRKFKL